MLIVAFELGTIGTQLLLKVTEPVNFFILTQFRNGAQVRNNMYEKKIIFIFIYFFIMYACIKMINHLIYALNNYISR